MQDTNVISHSMLVDRDEQGNAFTTSLVIADGTGNEHRAVLQLVKTTSRTLRSSEGSHLRCNPLKQLVECKNERLRYLTVSRQRSS